jgi:pimeloyl-ACP methyl ester carboxylesterase
VDVLVATAGKLAGRLTSRPLQPRELDETSLGKSGGHLSVPRVRAIPQRPSPRPLALPLSRLSRPPPQLRGASAQTRYKEPSAEIAALEAAVAAPSAAGSGEASAKGGTRKYGKRKALLGWVRRQVGWKPAAATDFTEEFVRDNDRDVLKEVPYNLEPQHLDYGIYFLGPNNTARKYRKGETNPFFSGTSKIMLFTHGWAGWSGGGHSARSANDTFQHDGLGTYSHPDADLVKAWIDQGWNVAAFFWDSFAKETVHLNVEAKIWTSESPLGMRYSTNDGYQSKDAPKVSAADLLRAALEELMSDCEDGVQLRLVGHSMGSQMALRASYMLAKRVDQGLVPERYLPSRIALLDPYWSPKWYGYHNWLGKLDETQGSEHMSTASLSSRFAGYLAERFGIPFEIYTSCPPLTQQPLGDSNPVGELLARGYAAVAHLRPNYCHRWDWPGRHQSVLGMYLWSMTMQYKISTYPSIGAPSAGMSDQHLRRARGSEWVETWEEEPGVDSHPVSISCFRHERQPQPPESQSQRSSLTSGSAIPALNS